MRGAVVAERRSPFGNATAPGHADVAIPRGFTTKDFTALRAYVQCIAPAIIARIYSDSDEDAHAATPGAMKRPLNGMIDTLLQLALAHGSRPLAEHLRASIKQHGQPKLTAVTFRMLSEAAQLAAASPAPGSPDRRIKREGIANSVTWSHSAIDAARAGGARFRASGAGVLARS